MEFMALFIFPVEENYCAEREKSLQGKTVAKF